MLFRIALLAWFVAWLIGASFSFRLRRLHPDIFGAIESPPANTWYPVWVFRLLAPGKFNALGPEARIWTIGLAALETFAVICTFVVAVRAVGLTS